MLTGAADLWCGVRSAAEQPAQQPLGTFAGGLAPAPGALARLYESMGGRVVYVGKPHAPIFDAALAALSAGVSANAVLGPRAAAPAGNAFQSALFG